MLAQRKIFVDTVWSALAHLFVRGGVVVAFMLWTTRLSVADFAALGHFNLLSTYVAAVALFGLSPLVIRHFAAPDDEGSARELGALLLLVGIMVLVASAIMSVVDVPSVAGMPRGWFILLVVTMMLGAVPTGALSGMRDFRGQALAAAVAATILVACAALPTARPSFAVLTLVGAFLAKVAIEALLALRRASAHGALVAPPRRDDLVTTARTFLVVGSAAIINPLGMWWLVDHLQDRADDLVFATFVIAWQWYAVGAFLAANLTKAIMPLQVRMAVEEKTRANARRLVLSASAIAVAGCAAAAAIVWAGRPVWTRFYADSLDLAMIVPLFLLAAASVAPLNMLGNQAVASRRNGVLVAAGLAWVAVLLATAGAALAAFGLPGIALSVVLANLAYMATSIVLLVRGDAL